MTADIYKQRISGETMQNTPEFEKILGSSTVYARSLQKKPMNEKTELKKTGITPIVK